MKLSLSQNLICSCSKQAMFRHTSEMIFIQFSFSTSGKYYGVDYCCNKVFLWEFRNRCALLKYFLMVFSRYMLFIILVILFFYHT